MGIQDYAIRAWKEARPRRNTIEAVVDGHVRAIACTDACDSPHHVVGLQITRSQPYGSITSSIEGDVLAGYSQASDLVRANSFYQSFVDDSEHRDDVLVFGLRYELGDNPNVVERSLGICETHHAVEEVDLTPLSRVIVT